MRVIAGKAKKTTLKSPKGMNTRPTADKVKESVFNILAPRVPDAFFLDLFAGTGAMAIEALSRGAKHAVLVEKNIQALKVIKDNLQLTKMFQDSEVMSMDITVALKKLLTQKITFDIIYIDPPYQQGYYNSVLTMVSEMNLLAIDGIIAVESSKTNELPDSIGTLVKIRSQKYGDTVVSFYQLLQQ